MTADRTPDYYFPRYLAIPPSKCCFPALQPVCFARTTIYSLRGMWRPAPDERSPESSAEEPVHPYSETLNNQPRVFTPQFQRKGRGSAGQPRLDRPPSLIATQTIPLTPALSQREREADLAPPRKQRRGGSGSIKEAAKDWLLNRIWLRHGSGEAAELAPQETATIGSPPDPFGGEGWGGDLALSSIDPGIILETCLPYLPRLTP